MGEGKQLGFPIGAEAPEKAKDLHTLPLSITQHDPERHEEQRQECHPSELVPDNNTRFAAPATFHIFTSTVPGFWQNANYAVKTFFGFFNGGQARKGKLCQLEKKPKSARHALQLGPGRIQNESKEVVQLNVEEHNNEGDAISQPIVLFLQPFRSFASRYPSRNYPVWQNSANNNCYETLCLVLNNSWSHNSSMYNVPRPIDHQNIMERISHLQELLSDPSAAPCCRATPRFSPTRLHLRVPLSSYQDKKEISIYNNHL